MRIEQQRAVAAQQSDLLLLVLHAMTPARQADVDMVQKLRAHFEKNPALKMPPEKAQPHARLCEKSSGLASQ